MICFWYADLYTFFFNIFLFLFVYIIIGLVTGGFVVCIYLIKDMQLILGVVEEGD